MVDWKDNGARPGSALARRLLALMPGAAHRVSRAGNPAAPNPAEIPVEESRSSAYPSMLPAIHTERTFGLSVADLASSAAVARVMAWSARPPARVVLLAKFDLVSAMRRDRLLQRACDEADLVLAGERTFDLIARLEGRQPLPAVAAIDLVEPLMRAAEASGRSVFLFGLPVEVGHRAARRLRIRYPDLRLAGLYGPPEGFERDPRLNAELAFILRSVRPDIVLVGLETGVQEVWAAGMADAIRSGVFVTLGDGLRTWARADREARALSFYRAALAWLGAVVAAALRVGRKLVALPALVRFHRTDRARYGAAQRRRLIALQTEERYRRARIVTRQADTDAALRTRYGMEETR